MKQLGQTCCEETPRKALCQPGLRHNRKEVVCRTKTRVVDSVLCDCHKSGNEQCQRTRMRLTEATDFFNPGEIVCIATLSSYTG